MVHSHTRGIFSIQFTSIVLIFYILSVFINVSNVVSQDIPRVQSVDGRIPSDVFIAHDVDHYYWLNDFVLVDIDGDSLIDISASNHSFRPRVKLNNGDFNFKGPGRESPYMFRSIISDLTPSIDYPDMNHPGLYLYRDGILCKVVGKDLDDDIGEITFIGDADDPFDSFHIVNVKGDVEGVNHTQLNGYEQLSVKAGRNFEITLAPTQNRIETSILTLTPSGFPASSIRIGPRAIESLSHKVIFQNTTQTDLHNLLWFDFNHDGILDVVIVQGGLLGAATTDNRVLNDILLLSNPTPLIVNVAEAAGIDKNGWPGRGVMIADIDRNGLQDIYVLNSRPEPPRQEAPNLLHMQRNFLQFHEEGETRGINILKRGVGKFVDINGDGWVDLVWGDDTGVRVYENVNGVFHKNADCAKFNYVAWLSVGDFDNDGDLDIAVAGYPQSMILMNESGRLRSILFTKYGLPKKSSGIQLVDYDNDGRLDVYAHPQGLFLQKDHLSFVKTNLLTAETPWARFGWGDLNNDGKMDLVRENFDPKENTHISKKDIFGKMVQITQAPSYSLIAFENAVQNDNQWLEIRLVGPENNPQAVGATVLLNNNGTTQLAMVGQFDSSKTSIGEYRIHFGLGHSTTSAPNVTINWPNGKTQVVHDIQPNRIHTIRYEATDSN